MWKGNEVGSRSRNPGLRKRTGWLPRLVAQGGGPEERSESKMATHVNKESSGEWSGALNWGLGG